MFKDNKLFSVLLILVMVLVVFWAGKSLWFEFGLQKNAEITTNTVQDGNTIANQATASVTFATSPTPTPTKTVDMEKEFGPCINLPVLMYHHVESNEEATLNKRTGLNVSPEMFKSQMNYLKEKGYKTIKVNDLINFFDSGVKLSTKSVLITFDDGYTDIYKEVFSVLKEFGFVASVYLPTGLMENPDYLKWDEIKEMYDSSSVYFGNHTWSHINVAKDKNVVKKEIETADTQLKEKNLNEPKTFVYPYGLESDYATKILVDMGYKLGFTTHSGRLLCKEKRMNLPRIRVGNAQLSAFGI